jgi:hypothetical protein
MKTSGFSQWPAHRLIGMTRSMAASTAPRSVKVSRYSGMKPNRTLIIPQKPEKITSSSTNRQFPSTVKISANTLPRLLPAARSSRVTGSRKASSACASINAQAAAETQKT